MFAKLRALALLAALAAFPATALAANVIADVDLDSVSALDPALAAGNSHFITNSNVVAKSATVTGAGDWDIAAGSNLYLGFTGNDTTPGIAAGKVTVNVGQNMNVNGATWVGKWDTTLYSAFFPELPTTPSNNVELNVGGNLNINITGSGFGAFMVGAEGAGSTTAINVTGDTNIYTGGNHFTGYNGSTLNFTTNSFNLLGGEIEVIGTSVVKTTNTVDDFQATRVTNEGELTIMRGAAFDLTSGGHFVVDSGSSLIGGSGGGTIRLKSTTGLLSISEDSTVNLWRGSLAVTGAGSTVDMRGTLILGFHPSMTDPDGNRFTSFTGANLNFADTAKIEVTNDFITKAMAAHTTSTGADANVIVISGSESLAYAPDLSWTSGDKVLLENFYGKFTFTRTGNNISFKNVDTSYFDNAAAAQAAAREQYKNVLAGAGVSSKYISSGYVKNMLGVAATVRGSSIAGVDDIASDGSAAGDLAFAILGAPLAGSSSFSAGGVSGAINTAFANTLMGNTGSNVNAVSMGTVGQVQNSIAGRMASTRSALASVSKQTGSDYALASRILDCDYMNRVWVGGLAMWEDADARKGLSGYKYDSYGVIAGYDRMFGAFTFGGAFGYTGGDYEDKAARSHDSDIESYAFSLYGAYNHCSGFFASVSGGYTYSDNDINEHDGANWSREDFHTDTWNIGGKVGYDWKVTDCLTLTPSVGLSYVHSKNSAHSVNYGGVRLLRYGNLKNHATTIPVEVAAGYDIATGDDGVLNLNASVGYSYNFNNDGAEGNIIFNGLANGTAWRATGRESGRHTFNAGAGFKYTRGRFDCGLRYDYFGKADYDAHRLVGTVGISF